MQYLNLIVNYFLMFSSRKTDNKKVSKVLLFFSFGLLWLFSAFREYILPYELIGKDYSEYVNWFNVIGFTSKLQYKNFGFNLLILFIKLFTDNYIVLFGITSFIILYGIYKFVYQNSKYPELSVYLFITLSMFSVSFNAVRQWIACSIIWWGYKYIKERSFLKFFLTTFIASLFHLSALVVLIIYFFANCKFNMRKKIILCLIVAVVLCSPLANSLIKLYSNIGENYYEKYVNAQSSASNYVMLAISVVNFGSILFFKRKKTMSNEENIENSLLLLLVVFAFLAPINIFFSRMVIYFEPILLITIPKLIDLFKKNSQKYVYIMIMLVFLIAYID